MLALAYFEQLILGSPIMMTKPLVREAQTYSSMSTFQNCRRRFWLRYQEGLVPIEKPHALHFGSVTHDWLETWHETRSLEAAQVVIERAYADRHASAMAHRDWHYQSAMLLAYATQYAVETFEVIELEREFSGHLVNPSSDRRSRSFFMRGKVDGIVCDGGGLKLLEHKTAATITGDYVERLSMDLQIALYSYYAREALGYPIESVLYNVLVKPKLVQSEGETEEEYQARRAQLIAKSKTGKTSAKRKMPESDEDFQARLAAWFAAESRFTRIELLLDMDTIENVRQQVWDICQEILEARRTGRWHQNSRSCFGFGTCPYWPICVSKGNPIVAENQYRVEPRHAELSAQDAPTF